MINLNDVNKELEIIMEMLNIKEWVIIPHLATQSKIRKLMEDNENSDAIYNACILAQETKHEANIYIWNKLSKDKLPLTIIHECMHLVMDPLRSLTDKLISSISRNQYDDDAIVNTLYNIYNDEEERIINRISKVLASNIK